VSLATTSDRPYMWANHAHGPSVVAWLCQRGVGIDGGRRKLFQRWGAGAQASLGKVDEVLIAHGFHISELPDEVWLTRYCNGRLGCRS
jgi:hypothetical protein